MIKNSHNYISKKSGKEVNIGFSQTVKDQSYSIQEILRKFANGQELDVYNQPLYEDDVDHESLDINHFKRQDFVDKTRILEETKHNVSRLRIDIQNTKEDLQLAYKETIAEKEKHNTPPKEGDKPKE